MIKGFLMTSGGVALAMVLFALTGRLSLTAIVVAAVGIVMMVASPVFWLLRYPARVVYGILVIGLAVVIGAAGGSCIVTMVTATLR